jgi:hypothetical protein
VTPGYAGTQGRKASRKEIQVFDRVDFRPYLRSREINSGTCCGRLVAGGVSVSSGRSGEESTRRCSWDELDR